MILGERINLFSRTRTANVLILALLVLAMHKSVASEDDLVKNDWDKILHSTIADAYVKRCLFRTKSSNHFFVQVRIKNNCDTTLGLQNRGSSAFDQRYFYPANWKVVANANDPARMIIDETRLVPPLLGQSRRNTILAAYRTKTLKMIPARQSLSYFVDFNAGGINDLDRQISEYKNSKYAKGEASILIRMAGFCFATDGKDVDTLIAEGDTVIPAPIDWNIIPQKDLPADISSAGILEHK